MAQISATELFRFENFNTETTLGKVVGHNRTVTHRVRYKTDKGGVICESCKEIVGSLYGSPVFTLRKRSNPNFGSIAYILKLDTCGYPTRTTRDAIAEFMAAAGFKAQVSMAGGELACKLAFNGGGTRTLKSSGEVILQVLTPRDWATLSILGGEPS